MTLTDELLDAGYPNSLRPELHKALSARGIDYWVAQGITFWNRDDGCECLAYGYEANGVPKLAVKVVGFTDPAQAIAVTVGAGTCHIEETEHEREIPYDLPDVDGGWYTEVTYDCDECGYENRDYNIRFCGGCGRKVVAE